MDRKQIAIMQFIGHQVRFIQEMNDLDVPKFEIARVLHVSPKQLNQHIELFNIVKDKFHPKVSK